MQALCYDFVVMVLSIVKLSRQPSKSPLMKRLRAQGLVYFVVAVVTYITPTVSPFALTSLPCAHQARLGFCLPQRQQ